MSNSPLQTLSLAALNQLVRDNGNDRQLLTEIRSEFIRKGAQEEAQRVTKLLLNLSQRAKPSSPSESKDWAPGLTSKLSELERHFRQKVFNSVPELQALLEILTARDGRASEDLADEVRGRLKNLAPRTNSAASLAAPMRMAPPVSNPQVSHAQPSPLSDADYHRLFGLCKSGAANPEQVARLDQELKRRNFGPTHPVRQALAGFSGPPDASGAGPTSLSLNAVLQQRRKQRDERRAERESLPTVGFIQVRPNAERSMVEVYLGSPDHLMAAVAKMRKVKLRHSSFQGLTEEMLQEAMQRLLQRSWQDEAQRRKDYRLIPYLFLAGNPPYIEQHGAAIFLKELDTNHRLSSVKEVIQRYFQPEFRALAQQRSQLVDWIQRRLGRVELEKRKALWLLHYRQHLELFSPDPTLYTIGFLPPAREGWDAWEELEVPLQSWLYSDTLTLGMKGAVRSADPELKSVYYRRLQRTAAHDAKGSNTQVVALAVESFEVRRRCIEAALLEYVSLGQTEPDTALIAFVLDTLKDPRLKESAAWHAVDLQARELMQAWLSIEDLEMFFGELADDADEKSRVQFWKPFVLNRMVSTSRIFLGESVILRKKTKVAKYLQNGRYAKLYGKGKKDSEVCAFVLRIKDAIIVEFSKVGNACFIYDAKTFDPGLFSASKLNIDDMKRTGGVRLTHQSGWPRKFEETLHFQYGIRRPKV